MPGNFYCISIKVVLISYIAEKYIISKTLGNNISELFWLSASISELNFIYGIFDMLKKSKKQYGLFFWKKRGRCLLKLGW